MISKHSPGKEHLAITGFLHDSVVSALSGTPSGKIEVHAEARAADVVALVDPTHIDHVRLGRSEQGYTLAQIVLTDNAEVESVVRSKGAALGLVRFEDPVIRRLQAALNPKIIMI